MNFKWQYKVRSILFKENIANHTTDRAIREKVWKDEGENQEDVLYTEKFGEYKTEVEDRIETRQRVAKQGARGGMSTKITGG